MEALGHFICAAAFVALAFVFDKFRTRFWFQSGRKRIEIPLSWLAIAIAIIAFITAFV